MDRQAQNKAIGNRVREIREFQGLSREKAAEKANISTQFLSDIEVGRKSMTTITLCNLTRALCVSADYLLFGKEEKEDSTPLQEILDTMTSEELSVAEDMIKVLIRGFSLKE